MFKAKVSYNVLGVPNRYCGSLLADFVTEDLEDNTEFLTILSTYDDPFWIVTNDDYNQCISLEIHTNVDSNDGEKIKNIFKDILVHNMKGL